MGSGIFGIGVSGLNAAQTNLLTAGHNISNAATPGFHRQEVVLRNAPPQLTGGGFVGRGVEVVTVRRVYNEFLARQVAQTTAQSAQLDAYYSRAQQLDDMLGDATAGLAPALQDFFKAAGSVAADPSGGPARQTMLSAGQSLVARFQAMAQRYAELRDGTGSAIGASVVEINSLAQQIASLNQGILVAQSAGSQQPANDLLDQRDQLVAELNQETAATVVKQGDGTYDVFIGNGQALVVGNKALALTTGPAPDDPTRLAIGYVSDQGTAWIPDYDLQGGALGGYLAFRTGTLDPAQNSLGRIAAGLAQTFNDQHRLGQDLAGNLGGDFFTVPAPSVTPFSGTTPDTIAVAVTDVGKLTTSDYRLSYDGTNYTLTRLSDGTAVAVQNALPLDATATEGFRITAGTGTMKAGESFLVQPTRNAARDIGLAIRSTGDIAAAAPIRTSAGGNNRGTATISAGTVNAAGANLRQPITITFNGDGTYTLTGTGAPAGSQPYTSGGDIACNGWTVQVTGAPQQGDTFTVGPNTNGTGDNRNALALAQLASRPLLLAGSATYAGAYGQLVSDVGNKTRELQVTSEAQASLLTQTQKTQDSLSGVNLDEEAANLLRYQQAYQACGKVLQVAAKLFDTLLGVSQ